jgi:hypothetical protein
MIRPARPKNHFAPAKSDGGFFRARQGFESVHGFELRIGCDNSDNCPKKIHSSFTFEPGGIGFSNNRSLLCR